MLPQRPSLRAADLLQGKKNAFILCQVPQTNEAAEPKLQFGNGRDGKHRAAKASVRDFWGLFAYFSSSVMPGLYITICHLGEKKAQVATNHHWPSCNLCH